MCPWPVTQISLHRPIKRLYGGVGVPQIITTNNSKNSHGMHPEEYFGTVLLAGGGGLQNDLVAGRS